jgi:hypothetical protein
MFAFKTGARYMSHKVLNTYKSRLDAAWIVEFLSVITAAHWAT